MKTSDMIKQQINENPIIIYMKGSPDFPQCGFSGNAVAALKSTGLPFAFVNVLDQPRIMQALPEISDWPTFPQIFMSGELIGGGDIILEMLKSGSLRTEMENALRQAGEEVSEAG